MPAATTADTVSPAPIWRRLGAALYDGLMFVALVMAGAMLALIVAAPFGLDHGTAWYGFLRTYAFFIGLAYYGWSWTHGGQTLGMRAWRLRMRRIDGVPPGWLKATVRYGWGLVPLLAALLVLARCGYGAVAIAAAAALLLAPYLACPFDSRGRSLIDLLTGTEIVRLPAPAGQP